MVKFIDNIIDLETALFALKTEEFQKSIFEEYLKNPISESDKSYISYVEDINNIFFGDGKFEGSHIDYLKLLFSGKKSIMDNNRYQFQEKNFLVQRLNFSDLSRRLYTCLEESSDKLFVNFVGEKQKDTEIYSLDFVDVDQLICNVSYQKVPGKRLFREHNRQ